MRHAPAPAILAALFLALHGPVGLAADTYDPLATRGGRPGTVDLVAHDAGRARDIPLRLYLAGDGDGKPAPVVLFSHGLGGSNRGSAYLGEHWAARGYVAVFLQHPGSDESVWRDERPGRRRAAMTRAASPENFTLRVQDVAAVLDELERWRDDPSHPLHGKLDLDRVGMSGHSFGAVTTQAVSGQRFAGAPRFTDGRIDAAVLMSPSVPRRGGDPDDAFAGVAIPWLLLTGTRDDAPIGEAHAASRLAVFPALPAGDKYELVLHDAEHSAFTDRALPGERLPRNPNHHRAILALSTAFWDAYLRDDPAALAWLRSDAVRAVLEPRDRWQTK